VSPISSADDPSIRRRWRVSLVLVLVLAFVALAWAVVGTDAITAFDQRANAFFGSWRVQPWLAVFLWITELGAGAARIAVMATASGLLWAFRRGALLLPLWLGYLGSEATTWAAKYLLGRYRPEFTTSASAASPSFPSAHAAGSLIVYGLVAWLIAREVESPAGRRAVAAAAAAAVLLIGFSRVLLGVHYLSDVAGGYLVAGVWLLVATGVAARRRGG
jgi:undecaprenyl-diphosphatase